MSKEREPSPELRRLIDRRALLQRAAAGTVVAALGGWYVIMGDRLTKEARAQSRADGRPRLPPGQKVLSALKPMGGQEGDPSPGAFKLRVHGEVSTPLTLGFKDLLAMPQEEQALDVHCVTGWSVLGARWHGVSIAQLAKLAGVKPGARHVILEGAHDYTANIPLAEALGPKNLVAWRLDGKALGRAHGAPVRAVIPDLYFWKSTKWLTGIKFAARDESGYWEVRGYHNHGNPWKEERYG